MLLDDLAWPLVYGCLAVVKLSFIFCSGQKAQSIELHPIIGDNLVRRTLNLHMICSTMNLIVSATLIDDVDFVSTHLVK